MHWCSYMIPLINFSDGLGRQHPLQLLSCWHAGSDIGSAEGADRPAYTSSAAKAPVQWKSSQQWTHSRSCNAKHESKCVTYSLQPLPMSVCPAAHADYKIVQDHCKNSHHINTFNRHTAPAERIHDQLVPAPTSAAACPGLYIQASAHYIQYRPCSQASPTPKVSFKSLAHNSSSSLPCYRRISAPTPPAGCRCSCTLPGPWPSHIRKSRRAAWIS